MMDNKKQIDQIIYVLDDLAEDNSVPRNIRKGAKDSKFLILNEKEEKDVRMASAIYILDELANDPNIPLHGRTRIWSIISQLETVSGLDNNDEDDDGDGK